MLFACSIARFAALSSVTARWKPSRPIRRDASAMPEETAALKQRPVNSSSPARGPSSQSTTARSSPASTSAESSFSASIAVSCGTGILLQAPFANMIPLLSIGYCLIWDSVLISTKFGLNQSRGFPCLCQALTKRSCASPITAWTAKRSRIRTQFTCAMSSPSRLRIIF